MGKSYVDSKPLALFLKYGSVVTTPVPSMPNRPSQRTGGLESPCKIIFMAELCAKTLKTLLYVYGSDEPLIGADVLEGANIL